MLATPSRQAYSIIATPIFTARASRTANPISAAQAVHVTAANSSHLPPIASGVSTPASSFQPTSRQMLPIPEWPFLTGLCQILLVSLLTFTPT
jgi:hypothetical protein